MHYVKYQRNLLPLKLVYAPKNAKLRNIEELEYWINEYPTLEDLRKRISISPRDQTSLS